MSSGSEALHVHVYYWRSCQAQQLVARLSTEAAGSRALGLRAILGAIAQLLSHGINSAPEALEMPRVCASHRASD